MQYSGTVRNGVIELEHGVALPDGTRVQVVVKKGLGSESLRDLLLEFAGAAKGLPADMAANHDHYLHGLPKR